MVIGLAVVDFAPRANDQSAPTLSDAVTVVAE